MTILPICDISKTSLNAHTHTHTHTHTKASLNAYKKINKLTGVMSKNITGAFSMAANS